MSWFLFIEYCHKIILFCKPAVFVCFAQELSGSLEMVYGQVSEVNDSEEVFQQFFKWKRAEMEEFVHIRNDTDAALKILINVFSGILKVSQVSPLLLSRKKMKHDVVSN